jgi:hypothetical protein
MTTITLTTEDYAALVADMVSLGARFLSAFGAYYFNFCGISMSPIQ